MKPQSDAPILGHSHVTAPGRTPERWLLFLHGVYGKGRNWGTIARQLVEKRPEWGAVLVDLRLHGESKGFEAPHTLDAAAEDVARLVEHLRAPAAGIVGHSFGGKVSLAYAGTAPPGLEQVWVMDSTPAVKEPSGSAWGMIEVVRGLPERFESRAEAVEGLKKAGYPTTVGQWMTMNLEPVDGGYEWALDFDAVEAILRDFFRTDLWEVVESPPEGMEVHLVKATRSDVLTEDAVERIEAANARNGRAFVHHVEGGHWINTDNPEAILELLVERLP